MKVMLECCYIYMTSSQLEREVKRDEKLPFVILEKPFHDVCFMEIKSTGRGAQL